MYSMQEYQDAGYFRLTYAFLASLVWIAGLFITSVFNLCPSLEHKWWTGVKIPFTGFWVLVSVVISVSLGLAASRGVA